MPAGSINTLRCQVQWPRWKCALSKKNVADLRFMVRSADSRHSSHWRLWITKKGDLYIATSGMAGIAKVSFHQSGIARYANTTEFSASIGKERRPISRWLHPTVPKPGSGKFARLFGLSIPTDYLSKTEREVHPATVFISAAPPGQATFIEVGLTCESADVIVNGLAGADAGGMLLHSPIRPGAFAFVRWVHAQWENQDLTSPSAHGLRGIRFNAVEVVNPHRPLRITIQSMPNDGDALLCTELGGCYE